MKKNTSYILTFLLGSIFGAFTLFNLWKPPISTVKSKGKSDLKINRFDRDFDVKAIKRRHRKERKKRDAGDQIDRDLDQMRDQMQQALNGTGNIFKLMEKAIQGATIDTMGVSVGEITEKITKDFVILEMDITNIDNSTLNIDIKNGQISMSGEARIEQKKGSSSSVMVSSFSRSYPVPRGTRASGFKIKNIDENTLQMIFPKIK